MEQLEAFRVLASADRQLVLHELVTRSGSAPVDTLSRQVAARRHRIAPEKLGDDLVERAHLRLVHTHLPYLEAVGLVDVDWDDRIVSLTDGSNRDRLFEAAEELDSWPPDDLLVRSVS